jgi:hypothetical protein
MKTLNNMIALAINTEVFSGVGQNVLQGKQRCKAYSFRERESTNHCGQDRVGCVCGSVWWECQVQDKVSNTHFAEESREWDLFLEQSGLTNML